MGLLILLGDKALDLEVVTSRSVTHTHTHTLDCTSLLVVLQSPVGTVTCICTTASVSDRVLNSILRGVS